MPGTVNGKNRHVKVELLNDEEYEIMLNIGKSSLFGHLIDVDEFLPAPKLLICGRCSQPGHAKKTCQDSTYDLCRRCGGDRTNPENRKECHILCHRCGSDHVSTNYRCKLIDSYRRQLINERRINPERLPPKVHLFIPSGYRCQSDRSKSTFNGNAYEHQRTLLHTPFGRETDFNAWPSLGQSRTDQIGTSSDCSIKASAKAMSDGPKRIEQHHDYERTRIEQKFKSDMSSIRQVFALIRQGHETHQIMLHDINTA